MRKKFVEAPEIEKEVGKSDALSLKKDKI